MSKKAAVPDAWEDDWTNNPVTTDKPPSPAPAPKLTKAEKRAQHQELQKQLWDSAENPTRSYWLESQGVVPNKHELKPQMKLLSRKPQPMIAKRDPATGMADLTIDDGEDSEEERKKKAEADFEERKRKAQGEREDKLRRYAEARERIMGSTSTSTPATGSRESSQGRDNRKARGRPSSNRNSQPTSTDQSPARINQQTASGQPLFDPEDTMRRSPMPKPNTPTLNGPTRQPRAPPSDHASRGGFGFAGREGRPAISNT
ncbi:hypothetical protein LTR78_007490 [Recurvomyces mirabilis]|uniref:SUZ domain-containing protein n=1 Tax=Recurvomyces mirabilis TaxID=574656 RepID=A0AAE0WG52_9PEZI|nr:hypothetical protein LTR78_007490 [Recurvomyces mirabilis]KAK5160000.1 hypothetical protein LTS14_002106 [Recurvomyces mirabilis]